MNSADNVVPVVQVSLASPLPAHPIPNDAVKRSLHHVTPRSDTIADGRSRRVRLGCGTSNTASSSSSTIDIPAAGSAHLATIAELDSTSRKGSVDAGLAPPPFPALQSPQRVSNGLGAPGKGARKKVQLKPGHSLLDWIRVTNSGKDLTGVGGFKGVVWDDELARHNTEDDAWTCVRGLVYNVTPYLDFHPGGRDFLMQGAGKDATDLFETYHQWINAESMLGKCLIGKLKKKISNKSTEEKIVAAGNVELTATSVFAAPSPVRPASPQPRYEWFQKEDSLMIVIYTKWPLLRPCHVTIDRDDKELRIVTKLSEKYYVLRLELEGDVMDDCQVRVNEKVGKAELVFNKKDVCKWSTVGRPLSENGKFSTLSDLGSLVYRPAIIVLRTALTHDVYLYKLQLPHTCRLPVPIGYHVYVDYCVEQVHVQRPYTVVDPSLTGSDDVSSSGTSGFFYLMIKIYADGLFTSALDTLNIGDSLDVSVAEGSFDIDRLARCRSLFMYAAGTGFTPMVRLINYVNTSTSVQKISLVFFNKAEEDIIWRDELDALAASDHRFEVIHILSQPDSDWTGRVGRITDDTITDTSSGTKDGSLICICGPPLFTQLALRLFNERGISDQYIHAFKS